MDSDDLDRKINNLPPDVFGMLALRQHRLNQAVGINRVTRQVELYLCLYASKKAGERARERHLAEKEYLEAAFLTGLLNQKQKAAGALLKEAQARPDDVAFLEKVLAEATELQYQAAQIAEALAKRAAHVG